MSTTAQSPHGEAPDFLVLWQGDGVINERDLITCPLGQFMSKGVQVGDRVELTTAEGASYSTVVLQVESEESLTVGEVAREPLVAPGGSTVLPTVKVSRLVKEPCPICREAGEVAATDHFHCMWCRTKRVPDERVANCPTCIAEMRAKLIQSNQVVERFEVLRGKRTIVLHGRSVSESDSIQEVQDQSIILNPKLSMFFYSEDAAKLALAYALDDDGTGKNPAMLVQEGTPTEATVRLPIMIKHFRGMNDAYYKAILRCLHRLDTLIEDACIERIEDPSTDEDILELAEQLATSIEEVTGEVSIFGGRETLVFAAPSRELVDEANAFAEQFIQANQGKCLKGRERFIYGLARFVAYFRADSKAIYGSDSGFNERIAYVMSLPMPLYYLYLSAAGVWQRRLNRASEVTTLGNS